MCEIDLDVLELIENILAKNAVDLSVHCVGDALHILYENVMVFPNSRSGDQCRFSPAPVSYESGALLGGSACRRLIGSSPDASGLRICRGSKIQCLLRTIFPISRSASPLLSSHCQAAFPSPGGSAVELLTSDDIQCVKRCAAEDCDWLFMDDSRSRKPPLVRDENLW